jgi:hypothetical protein
VEHTPQLRIGHISNHHPPISDKHRVARRIQRHWFSRRNRLAGNIHDFVHLSHHPTSDRGSPSTASLVAGTLRHLRQYRRGTLLICSLGLCILPHPDSCNAGNYELERGYVWVNYDLCCGLLFRGGKKGLHSARR